MTVRIDFSVGPVQGFVEQSRRTRDLWGSSYLLSFLSAHAMRGAQQAGGRIVRPVVEQDPLFLWILGRRDGAAPRIGSVPNRFVIEAGGDAREVARAGKRALDVAWKKVCDAVWERFVAHACPAGNGTERIWNRQTHTFWDVTWTAGPFGAGRRPGGSGGLLARRKHWRSHCPPDEPGDKCTVMHDLQELSGYVRAENRESRQNQDRFWDRVRGRTGALDLRDNERLCAVALVKRLFAQEASSALGWEVDTSHWPSTVYVGAVPWIREVVSSAPEQARQYAETVQENAPDSALAERRPPFAGLDAPAAGSFPKLDANCLHRDFVQNERLCPLPGTDGPGIRAKLDRLLTALYGARNDSGHPIGPPSSFYALLLADGDRLGRLVSKTGGETVGRALSDFTRDIPRTVHEHDGVAVYAGGDDVLAMLSVPQALSCAFALSKLYASAFGARGVAEATLSAAVVFAHVRHPLRSVLSEAHKLLDDIAKDANGRNSVAAAVLKDRTAGG